MLYDKITAEIKSAMLDKNNVKRDCLRSIISEIKNQTINAGKEITEDICISVIKKSVKQHEDSIENFKSGNREDLALKEMEELNYIQVFLPKMLDEDATKRLVDDIIFENKIEMAKKSIGIIMKNLPSNVDKKFVSKYLSTLIK